MTASPDDRAESEQLLSAILRSTHGDRRTADDESTAVTSAPPHAPAPQKDGGARDAHGDRRGEQVVLRELDPEQAAAPTNDDTLPDRESSVTASLLHALTDDGGPGELSTATATPTRDRPSQPDDPSDAVDITHVLSTLDAVRARRAGASRHDERDRDGIADDRSADTATDAGDGALEAPGTEPVADDEGPAAAEASDATAEPRDDAEATSDPTDPDTPSDEATPETDQTDHTAAEPPPDTTAEPRDDADRDTQPSEADDAPAPVDAAAPTEPSDTAEGSAASESSTSGTGAPASATAQTDELKTDELRAVADGPGTAHRTSGGRAPVGVADAASTPAADGPEATAGDEPESLRTRLRAAFREIGAWTAVAQGALIVTGLLCVFQVVVLLVLLRFLLQAAALDTTSAADALTAHGRAINVMLPALVACALVVVALVIVHTRRAADEPPETSRPVGVPVSLWLMIAAASMVAGVVVVDASSTVEQAAQMTMFAITACALLAATAFVAPRGIALAVLADGRPAATGDDSTPRSASGSGTAPHDDAAADADAVSDRDTAAAGEPAAATAGADAPEGADTAGGGDAATGHTSTAERATATPETGPDASSGAEPTTSIDDAPPTDDNERRSVHRDPSADVSDVGGA